jgi:hypothetical protein
MELQLPFIKKILADHPNTEYHVWDLALTEDDHRHIQTISGDRITVHEGFYNDQLKESESWFNHQQFNNIYLHYTNPRYKNTLFVKLDEDIVFIEAGRFKQFIEAVDRRRGSVISAQIVNGKEWIDADVPHNHFFEHWRSLIRQPIKLIPTFEWLSINMIGYDWQTGCKIADAASCDEQAAFTILGLPPNETFEGRGVVMQIHPDGSAEVVGRLPYIGDEGAVNLLPRLVMQGFLACHLYFGPQRSTMTETHIASLQKRYAQVGQQYLSM